jgi:GGDEF domain-containing protein
LIAGGALLAAVASSYLLRSSFGAVTAGPVFCVVVAACAALVIFARDVGAGRGALAGTLAGLVASTGLALHFPSPISGTAAFIVVSTGILGLVGYLSGMLGQRTGEPRGGAPGSAERLEPWGRTSTDYSRRARGGTAAQSPVDTALGALATDFGEWVDSEAGRQSYAEPADWSAFDQFVRTALRSRFGAASVRLYILSADGQWLEPATRGGTNTCERLAAREGTVGEAVASGRVVIRNGAAAVRRAAGKNAGECRKGEEDSEQPARPDWAWILPIQQDRRTRALITVGRIERPEYHTVAAAVAARNQTQLFWSHLVALRSLWTVMRLDRQSGLLRRADLLQELDEILAVADENGESVMLLALAVEGFRQLDDSGHWGDRDRVVERLGCVLRSRARPGDVLGRLSDERFLVVLRNVDTSLATLLAEKLIDTIQSEVLDPASTALVTSATGVSEPRPLRLRAGLAGTSSAGRTAAVRAFATYDSEGISGEQAIGRGGGNGGKPLLQRALGLLDYARTQYIDIATDVMKGLPEHLARGGTARSPEAPAQQQPAATADDEAADAPAPPSGGSI